VRSDAPPHTQAGQEYPTGRTPDRHPARSHSYPWHVRIPS
jgi:hypothetical protein